MIGLCTTGYSQTLNIEDPKIFAEKAYLHYNSNFLMPGEKLLYKLYILKESNGKPSSLSKVGRVVLLDKEGEIIFSHLLDLHKGSAYSDFLIPSDIETGTYKLIGYTNWMKNYDDQGLFETSIHILNPFNADLDFQTIEKKPEKLEKEQKPGSLTTVALNTSQDVYGPREKVIVNISGITIDSLDRFSVSVRKSKPLALRNKAYSRNNGKPTFSFQHAPEYRGRTFSGTVVDSTGNKISDKHSIFYAVPGRTDQFRVFQSRMDGSFEFQVAEPIGYASIYLTVENRKYKNARIQLDTPTPDFEEADQQEFDFSVLNPENIRRRAIQIQIENYYGEVKQDSVIPAPVSPVFYKGKASIYNLDDYTRFETMDDTFIEIIPLVSFRSKRKNPVLEIQQNGQNSLEGIPLVLLDGQQIIDHKKVFELDPHTIQEIRIVREKYYLGPSFFQGIVDIRSKSDPQVVLPEAEKFEIQPTESRKKYFHPDYEQATMNNIPDFRNQLSWVPEVKNNQLEFFTSDVTGDFIIQLKGFGKSGQYISVTKQIEVSDER